MIIRNTKKTLSIIFGIGAALLFANGANAMSISVSWTGTASCFDSGSPVFNLAGVSKSAKKLRFRMIDLDKPSFDHGGGTVPYTGQKQIGKGAFNYKGPCPPDGPHRYEWTVDAMDADGKVVDQGRAVTKFPPK